MKHHIAPINIIITISLLLAACGASRDQKYSADLKGEDIRAIVREEISAAMPPTPSPSVSPSPPAGMLSQLIDQSNPWLSHEEKAARARKYGFTLTDENGQLWARLHRIDEQDIAQVLYPATSRIETEAEPVVTKNGTIYTIDFRRQSPSPAAASAPPTATPPPPPAAK